MKGLPKAFVWLSAGIMLSVSGCGGSERNETRGLLRELVAEKWGAERVVLPSPTVLVQYEADLGERWIVDFEAGEIVLEGLWPANTELSDVSVTRAMACAVSNLYVSVPLMPDQMLARQQQAGSVPAQIPHDDLVRKGQAWTYTVRKGDTVSGIAKRFRVLIGAVANANGLRNPNRIRVGQTLTIPEPPPHIHMPGEERMRATESVLRGQLRDPETGELIDASSVGQFAERIVRRNGVEGEEIRAANGRTYRLSRLKLNLIENHLQVRAERYYPVIKEQAERFGHDPAVIMAMVHTESAFNAMAVSPAGACGLMQLVPSSGGREAYRRLHGRDQAPSRDYLLRPRANVELGTAYLNILKERTFSGVEDPQSRLYCSVAAYNGGGRSVARAFGGRRSVRASLDRINAANPEQVRRTLTTGAPARETREYLDKVLARIPLYSSPAWSPSS